MGLESGASSTKSKGSKPVANNGRKAPTKLALAPPASPTRPAKAAPISLRKAAAKPHPLTLPDKVSKKKKTKARLRAAEASAPAVSQSELRMLMQTLEPTERKASELKYQLLLANPSKAEMVGVPLSMGGVPGASTKVRLFSSQDYNLAGGDTSFVFGAYQARGPQGFGLSTDPNDPDVTQAVYVMGHVPCWGNLSLVPGPNQDGYNSTDVGDALYGPGAINSPIAFSNATNSLAMPDPKLDLRGSLSRLVAQEVRIFPTSNLLDSMGVGTMFQTASSSSYSLNGKTYAELFGLQGIPRESRPLANWVPGECFRAVRIPQDPQDLNFLQSDWTGRASGAPGANGIVPGQVGPIWCCFFAVGLNNVNPMSFRVEVDSVYEILNNAYPINTSNVGSGGGLEVASSLEEHIPPHVTHPDDIASLGHSAVARAQAELIGPKHAAAVINHAANGSYAASPSEGTTDFGQSIASEIAEVGLGILGALF